LEKIMSANTRNGDPRGQGGPRDRNTEDHAEVKASPPDTGCRPPREFLSVFN
jgi:hypothetical protein